MDIVLALQDEHRNDEALTIWREFEAVVAGCPIPHAHQDDPSIWDFVGCPWTPGMFASAELRRANRTFPERVRICLTEEFFQQRRQSQIGLLIHEGIHVRMFLGRLQANYRAIENARRQPRDDDDFVERRRALAMDCLMFVQEVGADRYFHDNEKYRGWWEVYLGQRMSLYYRPEGDAALEESGDPAPLKLYRVFYRLLRTELGLTVVDDLVRQRALEERRDYLQGRLRALAPQDFERLTTTVQAKLLAVTVDTDDADPESYTDLCDEVLGVPVPGA